MKEVKECWFKVVVNVMLLFRASKAIYYICFCHLQSVLADAVTTCLAKLVDYWASIPKHGICANSS